MSSLRAAAAQERSAPARRQQLMHEFARLHRPQQAHRVHWIFAAAAAVLFALALGLSRRAHILPGQAATTQIAMRVEPAGESDEISDASGFVPVPYAPPLATGEFVKVVRTELYAAALDRMGVSVPAGNGEFPAEVMVGEDGLPRAVRVLDDVQF